VGEFESHQPPAPGVTTVERHRLREHRLHQLIANHLLNAEVDPETLRSAIHLLNVLARLPIDHLTVAVDDHGDLRLHEEEAVERYADWTRSGEAADAFATAASLLRHAATRL
jgi:hypothetical protein